jgi:regulator of protease activity HflC (stomatin/prohibitin superfamily)
MSIIYTVPEKHCVLIKRFNKFVRVQGSGLNVKLPFIESFHNVTDWGDQVNKNGVYIELTEQQTDTRPRQCQTKDNVTVEANASVYWRIFDPEKACFEVDTLPDAIADVALNALRSQVGMMELDEVLSSREKINERIKQELMDSVDGWGVKIRRVEIQELTVDEETRRAMTQQMEAERKRRARVAESEGESEYKKNVAEAEKEAAIRRAEGEAEALNKLAEAEQNYLETLQEEVGREEAARILIAEKFIQGFDTISQNEGDKVFLPNNFQALFGLDTDNVPETMNGDGSAEPSTSSFEEDNP